VPGIQVGLAAFRRRIAPLVEPDQERGGLDERPPGILVSFGTNRLPFCDGSQLAKKVPGGETLEQTVSFDVVDFGQPFRKPALEQDQVPVDVGSTPWCMSRSRR
jgi:hypothetical protein